MPEASMRKSTVDNIGMENKTRGLRKSWEESSGLCGYCHPIQAKFPKCSAVFLRMLLPLWNLVCIALIGEEYGMCISSMEMFLNVGYISIIFACSKVFEINIREQSRKPEFRRFVSMVLGASLGHLRRESLT
jgi:hypothetical protein